MVLVDHRIREEVKTGHLGIEDFDESCLQPATYDLRIGALVYSPSLGSFDEPYDLSKNGGAYRIPPYGSATLTTHETLRMPNDMVGRFGLKSGFARRGLFASTGPQIDPGFDGKLFISLLNLTPASYVIAYKETFLSVEFQTLSEKPEKTYEGPYQHRRNIPPDILDDLSRMEGVNLSQMQTQFGELSRHVQEWSGLASQFGEFLQEMKRQTNTMADLVKQLAENRLIEHKLTPIEIRHIPSKQAKTEILSLFQKRGRLYYSDIARELNLDYGTVIRTCEQLQKEDLIEGDINAKKRPKVPRNKH